MIVLTGASASGKTEVAKYLMAHCGIVKAITTTTRAKRNGEINGKDYFFVTKEEFLQMIKEDKFVEYTIYNGNYYGSTKDQVKDDRCVVIDPIGVRSYIALNNKSVKTFFLEADEKVRYERMISRGDDVEKAKLRIQNDKEAFKKENIPKVDFVLINNGNCSIQEIAEKLNQLYLKGE